MGGDGGSIPGRADMVRTKGYKFARNLGGMGYTPNTQVRDDSGALTQNEKRSLRWKTCAISSEPLSGVICVCKCGNLYNKESLLKRLLAKKMPANALHVTALSDIKDCKIKRNADGDRIMCPLTCKEFEFGVKGVMIWSCGCLMSEKALRYLKRKNTGIENELHKCPVCESPYIDEDVIYLILTEEEFEQKQKQVINEKSERRKKRHKTTENNSKTTDKEDPPILLANNDK